MSGGCGRRICRTGFRQAMKDKLADRKNRLSLLAERLHGLSPLLKLQQGYSYTEGPDGRAVTGSIRRLRENG